MASHVEAVSGPATISCSGTPDDEWIDRVTVLVLRWSLPAETVPACLRYRAYLAAQPDMLRNLNETPAPVKLVAAQLRASGRRSQDLLNNLLLYGRVPAGLMVEGPLAPGDEKARRRLSAALCLLAATLARHDAK